MLVSSRGALVGVVIVLGVLMFSTSHYVVTVANGPGVVDRVTGGVGGPGRAGKVGLSRLEHLVRRAQADDASVIEPDEVTPIQIKMCQDIQNTPFGSLAHMEMLLEEWLTFQCQAVMKLEHVLHSDEEDDPHSTTSSSDSGSGGSRVSGSVSDTGDNSSRSEYTDHHHGIHDHGQPWNLDSELVLMHGEMMPTRRHVGEGTVEYVTPSGVDLTYTIHINTERAEDAEVPGPDWVAVCVSSTTRGIASPSIETLSLFSLMLPSLARTVEPGFRYRIVIVHDKGDAFYEGEGMYDEILAWFQEKISGPLARTGVVVDLLMVSFTNSLRKPGPAFNVMLRAAYDFGAEWFYRINDDSEFKAAFARPMIERLRGMGSPYGAVGPLCKQGNTAILTHDFVHRTHMEIFETYYPPALVDWWMDDWISRVYGARRTEKILAAEVIHHTHNHGTRYQVDFANEAKLKNEVAAGRDAIISWMKANGVDRDVIDTFADDMFENTLLSPAIMAKQVDHADRTTLCTKLKSRYNVVPNETWGSLSASDQDVWKVNMCDNYV